MKIRYYSKEEKDYILKNYEKLGKEKVGKVLNRPVTGVKKIYYQLKKDERENQKIARLQQNENRNLKSGGKYSLLIGEGKRKRLEYGIVIQQTKIHTTFQLKNYCENFLNWDLNRMKVEEI